MATRLVHAIRFRLLVSQLTKSEFKIFMSRLVDLEQSDWITSVMFNRFAHSPASNNDDDQIGVEEINTMVSAIIQSREPQSDSAPAVAPNLDTMPRAIIGHIASFADETNYFLLQLVNRSLYIGCNAPNMLQSMTMDLDNDVFSHTDLDKFQALKKLVMVLNPRLSHQLQLSSSMRNLKVLVLNASDAADFELDAYPLEHMSGVTTLVLAQFGSRTSLFNADTFWRLVAMFPNVQFLELCYVFLNQHLDPQRLPALQGLSIVGGPTLNSQLINHFGGTLRSLSLRKFTNNRADYSSVDFSNLEELKLQCTENKLISDIFKTAKNVKRCLMCPYVDRVRIPSLGAQDMKTSVSMIFKSCQSMECFDIESSIQDLTLLLEGMEDGLFESSESQRRNLRIRVQILTTGRAPIGSAPTGTDANPIVKNIRKIVHWLQVSRTTDFMFILNVPSTENDVGRRDGYYHEIAQTLGSRLPTVTVAEYSNGIIITSTDCKINGYSVPWMMKPRYTLQSVAP